MLNERENMPLPEEGKPLDNFTHLGNTIAFTVNNFHKRGGSPHIGILLVADDMQHLASAIAAQAEMDETLSNFLKMLAPLIPYVQYRRANKN